MKQAPGRASTEAEQAAFFEQNRAAFAQAAARTGEVRRDYRVGGIPVRLRFAGNALLDAICPGLAHPVEAKEGSTPACEICLWDSAGTGVSGAPRPRPVEDFTSRGNLWGFDSPRYRSAYQWGEHSVSVFDRQTGAGCYWTPSAAQLPGWTMAAPLRTLLHWIMERHGRQLVHAAAVGLGDRGILLPGRGGSGKSSTALACLEHGLDFLADDYLALALDPAPVAYRLYNTAKIDPAALGLYPSIAAASRAVAAPDFDKTVLFLPANRLRASLPIQQLLHPRIAGVPATSFGPIGSSEIEQALAGETLAHLAHVGPHTLDFLERVSIEIPAAALFLGTDRPGVVAAIRGALNAPVAPPPVAVASPAAVAPSDPPTGQRPSESGPGDAAAPPVLQPDLRPAISVVVHLHAEDRAALEALAADLQQQHYPRAELVIAATGAAVRLEAAAAALPGTVRFHRFDHPANKSMAWNRAIRESFAELLLFLEPADRLAPGALDALAAAARCEPGAALLRARVEFAHATHAAQRPLAGSLIRKDAFRRHGLFDPNPALAGAHERDWLDRCGPLATHVLDRAVLQAGEPPAAPAAIDLRAIKQSLDRRRTRP